MRRHAFDPVSFVLGALFMAVGLTFLFGDADIGELHLSVVWPIPLIVVGLLMLVTTARHRAPGADARPAPAEGEADEAGPVHTDEPE